MSVHILGWSFRHHCPYKYGIDRGDPPHVLYIVWVTALLPPPVCVDSGQMGDLSTNDHKVIGETPQDAPSSTIEQHLMEDKVTGNVSGGSGEWTRVGKVHRTVSMICQVYIVILTLNNYKRFWWNYLSYTSFELCVLCSCRLPFHTVWSAKLINLSLQALWSSGEGA